MHRKQTIRWSISLIACIACTMLYAIFIRHTIFITMHGMLAWLGALLFYTIPISLLINLYYFASTTHSSLCKPSHARAWAISFAVISALHIATIALDHILIPSWQDTSFYIVSGLYLAAYILAFRHTFRTSPRLTLRNGLAILTLVFDAAFRIYMFVASNLFQPTVVQHIEFPQCQRSIYVYNCTFLEPCFKAHERIGAWPVVSFDPMDEYEHKDQDFIQDPQWRSTHQLSQCGEAIDAFHRGAAR